MSSFVDIKDKTDFKWYKLSLDVAGKYTHKHYGEPEKYPCKVVSTWDDDPNGPYYYTHRFVYMQEVICPTCGHKTYAWPDVDPDTIATLE